MTKQDIMTLFLRNNMQLDLASMDFFEKNPGKIEIFLERAKGKVPPSIITLNFVHDTVDDHKSETGIEVLTTHELKDGKLTAQDYAAYFASRFEVISKMILRKMALMNPVSIGKISQRSRRFSVVGMVNEKDDVREEAVLEDPTGSLTLQFGGRTKEDFNHMVLDEVVGAVCEQENNVVASNLIWPDLPLRKEPTKASKDVKCVFVSDIHKCDSCFKKESYSKFIEWASKADRNTYIFVLGDVSHEKKDVDEFFNELPKRCTKIFVRGEIDSQTEAADIDLPNPTMINIDGVHILLSHGDFMEKYSSMWGAAPDVVMLNLLKKRHIDPVFDTNSKIFNKDPYLLDVPPDIFASGHFHKPSSANYKSVTILSTGSFITEPVFWSINLKDRGIIKLDFS
jgi:DNA polymerase II small subunit/DNA polymerase delta subunit B